MNDTIITVENLGKKYSLRHETGERYTALRDVIANKAASLFRRNGRGRARKNLTSDLRPPTSDLRATREDFWALKDVSFEVNRGEVVGIIGRNGAGKSTLLKILSRITDPTEGRVKLEDALQAC
jgi:lipopolysaccharide transport system ATP-binding protein